MASDLGGAEAIVPAHRLRPSFKDIELIVEDDGPMQSHEPISLRVGNEHRFLSIREAEALRGALEWALIDAHRDRDDEIAGNLREPDRDNECCCHSCALAELKRRAAITD